MLQRFLIIAFAIFQAAIAFAQSEPAYKKGTFFALFLFQIYPIIRAFIYFCVYYSF